MSKKRNKPQEMTIEEAQREYEETLELIQDARDFLAKASHETKGTETIVDDGSGPMNPSITEAEAFSILQKSAEVSRKNSLKKK